MRTARVRLRSSGAGQQHALTKRTVAVLASAVVTLAACGGGGDGPRQTTTSPPEVASVAVSPIQPSVVVGQSQQLTATVRDRSGTTLAGRSVTWASSSELVATVSTTGMVTGVDAGSVRVTATSEGKTGDVMVSVSPAPVVLSVTFASVATGGAHTCALSASGAAYCWGRGESKQLGVPVPTGTCPTDGGPRPCSRVPVAVQGGLAFTQLAAGGAHTCGLTSDGTAYCWGSSESGQLGAGPSFDRDVPVAVATGLKFASIDGGAQHTCALTSDGTAYCWGRNNRGQLGDGTTSFRSTPVAVTGGHTFRSIAAGGFSGSFAYGHTCALTTTGEAYCWGDNERGQLGIGGLDVAAHPEPARVLGALTFVGLTAGLGSHTCGLTAAGTAYCWGGNSFGALGNGSVSDSPVPVGVRGGLVLTRLVAGGYLGHTCGLTPYGEAYCWGDNEVGQVGDGSTIDRYEPSDVASLVGFTSIDAGYRHSCGRATDGAIYCWGSGGAGQLGINSTNPALSPIKVVGQP